MDDKEGTASNITSLSSYRRDRNKRVRREQLPVDRRMGDLESDVTKLIQLFVDQNRRIEDLELALSTLLSAIQAGSIVIREHSGLQDK